MTYEKTINELEESSKKLNRMIARIENKKIPQAIIGEGFQSLKGNLTWPVNGEMLIPYGTYKDPEFNIPVFKNGVEIESKSEDNPKAVAGGRVVYVGKFKGYGTMLIIDHGSGYHSLYGNLSEVFLKKGEFLAKGMDVGKISKSKLLNIPALYFEIRHKGKPVDPMKWLRR
jgi:septal ring factor EnvC (AmiA/AmiB activator)